MTVRPRSALCANPDCTHRKGIHVNQDMACAIIGCDCERFESLPDVDGDGAHDDQDHNDQSDNKPNEHTTVHEPTVVDADGVNVLVVPDALAAPVDLSTEPETDKALRFLRTLRAFAQSEAHLFAVEIDGVKIMLVKYEPDRHVFELQVDVEG